MIFGLFSGTELQLRVLQSSLRAVGCRFTVACSQGRHRSEPPSASLTVVRRTGSRRNTTPLLEAQTTPDSPRTGVFMFLWRAGCRRPPVSTIRGERVCCLLVLNLVSSQMAQCSPNPPRTGVFMFVLVVCLVVTKIRGFLAFFETLCRALELLAVQNI